MTLLSTSATEFGAEAADAIRDVTARLVGGTAIAGYIEEPPPLRWEAIADAGWDLVGVEDDEEGEGATLRDLVAVALAWGENPVQLPLVPSLVAKRHSAEALETEGPVSFSVPTQSSVLGWGSVPYGQEAGIRLVADFASGETSALADGQDDSFDFVMRSTDVPFVTVFTPVVVRELLVLWAAEAAGCAKRAVRDAVEFTKQREQFNKPIGSFQAVKHHMANAHIAVEQAETAAVWASLDEQNARRAALHSFTQSLWAVELALQVHGGLGFTWEMGVHFYLRHVVALRELALGVAGDA